jgi:endonuclease/exonuclease/phosphatase family metal-dependent hydrolase
MPRPLREHQGGGAETQPSTTVTTLKVLLFNVWQLPGFLTDGAPEKRAKAASTLIARSGADVVCLNEAFLNVGAVLSGVRDTHPHRAELSGRSGLFTPLGSGLRVASRWPLLAAPAPSSRFFFRHRSGADRFASKGVLHARINLNGGGGDERAEGRPPRPLDLFVTHMQAGSSDAEQASRRAQAAEAGAFVRAASRGEPFLLCGDLNMAPCASTSPHCATEGDAEQRAAAFAELCQAAGMRDAGAAAGAPAHEICRFCAGGGGGGGGSVRVLRVRNLGRRCPETGQVASDTDALLADVEVTTTAG